MSRPAQYVVQRLSDSRYAAKSGWVPNPCHASKHPSRYAAKKWANRTHPNVVWMIEQLHPVDEGDPK